MKKSIFSRWVQRCSILLAVFIAFSGAVFAQANYLSICNPTGTCSSCCGNYTNTFNCMYSPSPSSFTAIPSIIPFTPTGSGSSYYQNAIYDNAGNVLFMVDYSGIYDPTGNGVFAFSTAYAGTVTGCAGIDPTQPFAESSVATVSEVVTFPVPGKCNSYYVVFWCDLSTTYTIGTITYATAILRAIEVDLTPSFGNTAVSTTTWYNITDGAVDAPFCYNSNTVLFQADVDNYSFAVAADAVNADGSRDIYTLCLATYSDMDWSGRIVIM